MRDVTKLTLADTVDMMLSPNYKDRLIAEYEQMKIRNNSLANMLKKWQEGTLDFTPSCSMGLLQLQLSVQNEYLRILDRRFEVESKNQ